MNWDDLKYYLAVARSNNISDASEHLKVSASTVSRRILELEKELGTPLFNKRPSGYLQTQASDNIFKLAEEVEENTKRIERLIKNHIAGKSHTVRVNLPELLGNHILPELKQLQKNEAEIRFEITNSAKNTKLSARADDIVVRYERPISGSYKIKKIGQVSRALFCSKEYSDTHGIPKTRSDLSHHFLIGLEQEMDALPLSQWFADLTDGHECWMKTSNLTSQCEAVVSGLGIAALPYFIAKKYNLIPLLLDIPPLNAEIFLMKNTETASYDSVNTVATFIDEYVSSHQSDFVIPT